MSLDQYFQELLNKVEHSGEIHNGGKDKNGFYKPTRAIVLKNLRLLKDLHSKPLAKPMVKTAWNVIVEELPAEWLILSQEDKIELQRILDVE